MSRFSLWARERLFFLSSFHEGQESWFSLVKDGAGDEEGGIGKQTISIGSVGSFFASCFATRKEFLLSFQQQEWTLFKKKSKIE